MTARMQRKHFAATPNSATSAKLECTLPPGNAYAAVVHTPCVKLVIKSMWLRPAWEAKVHSVLLAGWLQECSILHGPVCEGDHQEGGQSLCA